MNQSFLILGREPSLSFAELYQYLGANKEKISTFSPEVVLVDDSNFGQQAPYVLAGIVKSGVIIKEVSKLEVQDLVIILKSYLKEDTKFNFGLSLYRLSQSNQALTLPSPWKGDGTKKLGLEIKKNLKALGASVRLVESRSNNLSAVDVVKNRLLKDGVELCIFTTDAGFFIGATQAVQPFEEYSHRDYDRPGRDAKSGMLPPKLAHAMVNIAVGTRTGRQILDPFCGSGTVLQEALLMGHNVIGTDIEPQAIADSKKNIAWLAGDYPELKSLSLRIEKCDVRQIGNILPQQSVDAVVSELDLGPPLSGQESEGKINSIIFSLNDFYISALRALQPILRNGGRAVLAWPYFKKFDLFIPLFNDLSRLGWEVEMPYLEIFKKDFLLSPRNTLIYGRPNQHVWREILILKKRQ